MTEHGSNPYASPSEDAQRQHSAKFTLDDDQRKIISSTAIIMIVAGIVQLLMTVIDVVNEGLTAESLVVAAVFGVVPCFVVIAGFSLRSAAALGSVDALLSGFRQLFVVFLVKGVMLLLAVGFGLLTVLLFALGIGRDLFS
jgi:hypothetical protein